MKIKTIIGAAIAYVIWLVLLESNGAPDWIAMALSAVISLQIFPPRRTP